jgi:hypothetical protein
MSTQNYCAPGEPSTEQNPCVYAQTLSDLAAQVDYSTAISAILTIMAALAGVFIVTRGGALILSKITGPTPSDYYETIDGKPYSPDEDWGDANDAYNSGIIKLKKEYENYD